MLFTFIPALNEGPNMFRAFEAPTAVLIAAGTYTVDLDADNVEDALEAIYRGLNIGSEAFDKAGIIDTYRRERQHRSLSVGDVVFITDPNRDIKRESTLRAFAVASVGFEEVDPTEAGVRTFGQDTSTREGRRQARIEGLRDVVENTGHAFARTLLEEEIRDAERAGQAI